jgi:transposase
MNDIAARRSLNQCYGEFELELLRSGVRHLIENFVCKLKQFRAIATRYDKTARNFLAGIHLVANVILVN